MTDRDATKKARGFSYQRQYAIYLFFNSINTDKIEIIEEGILNGLVYEDITIINNNNEYITYQIKYHTEKMRFNCSNKDLFKTIKNENNLQLKVKNVYFIVSKINNTFDTFLNEWKNNKLSAEEIYNSIINLGENKKSCKIDEYRECKIFLENDRNNKINYLSKIIIQEGFTYNELNDNINNIIKNIFTITDNIIIYYIRYTVFDFFEKNWFADENKPLNINEIYSEIKLKINNTSNNKFDYIFNQIIKKYINLSDEVINSYNIDNLNIELNNFINDLNNNFEIKHYLCFLNLLYNVNKKISNKYITELYDIIIKKLCRALIKIVKTENELTDEKIDNIISSLSYYRKHKINKSICLNKSKLNNILPENDKKYINQMSIINN